MHGQGHSYKGVRVTRLFRREMVYLAGRSTQPRLRKAVPSRHVLTGAALESEHGLTFLCLTSC